MTRNICIAKEAVGGCPCVWGSGLLVCEWVSEWSVRVGFRVVRGSGFRIGSEMSFTYYREVDFLVAGTASFPNCGRLGFLSCRYE
ncbi:unnamed protein product [Onchocerca flexuosa]|uniref:Uncharacterized protein n=1 Tax=Onchocerca flexuosa TaxID=387005 RepID=A0A183I213_9BILA|nr:unnamed protein product [Onchocerca flexuosa]